VDPRVRIHDASFCIRRFRSLPLLRVSDPDFGSGTIDSDSISARFFEIHFYLDYGKFLQFLKFGGFADDASKRYLVLFGI
jgi:hypothetical protein